MREIDRASVLFMKAMALYNLKRDEEALVCLDEVNNLAPNLSEVWCLRGLMLYRLGKLEECIDSFNKWNQICKSE